MYLFAALIFNQVAVYYERAQLIKCQQADVKKEIQVEREIAAIEEAKGAPKVSNKKQAGANSKKVGEKKSKK